MEEKNKDGIKILLNDVDKEFCRQAPHLQVRLAIEQMRIWQRRFNEAKNNALKENFVDTTLSKISSSAIKS